MADDKTNENFSAEDLLYAPIGAAALLRDMLPSIVTMLAARGRAQVQQISNSVNNTVVLAKSLGQMRVNEARENLEKRTGGVAGAARSGFQVVQGAGRAAATGAVETAREAIVTRTVAATGSPRDNGGGAADKLSIPDYDSLSASQVVERLQGLSPDELAAVRIYEETHRGRRTVLHRLDALLEA